MATTDTPAPKLPTPVMVLDAGRHERQEFAREMAERNKDPLSTAKREGGFYLRADGTPTDAENRPIPAEKLTDAERASIADHCENANPPLPYPDGYGPTASKAADTGAGKYDGMTVAELKAAAEGRKVTVDGTKKADYIAALEAADKAAGG